MTTENNATANAEIITCDFCGAIIEGEAIEVDGKHFCDAGCAMNAGYRECANCNEWFAGSADDCQYIAGEWFCSMDCAHECGWEQCVECGEWVKDSDAIWADDGDYGPYCSGSCAQRDNNFQCDRCGEWHHNDDNYVVSVEGGWHEHWCYDCWSEYARTCERCEEDWDEDCLDSRGRCPDCHNNDSEHLHEYGWTPHLEYYGEDMDEEPTLGIELETDGGDERGDYCDELWEIPQFSKLCWMTEDGSLDNGVEITTMPMTLSYHVKMLPMYESISETASRYDFVSHNGGRCGLHVNIGSDFFGNSRKAKELGGYKLLRLCQRFERQLMTFSRRTSDRWCHYHTSCDFAPKKDVEKISVLKASSPYAYDDDEGMFTKARKAYGTSCHSDCVNLSHISSRIEIRIFRGTLKWTTYFASLALANGMAHIAKNHGCEYIEDVDWYTFIDEVASLCKEPYAKECLENYLDEKGLL